MEQRHAPPEKQFRMDGMYLPLELVLNLLLPRHVRLGGRDMNLAIYTGSCGALSQVACVDATGNAATESITMNLTAGVTYYIELQQANGNASASADGTFCVTDDTPPANDEPCGASIMSYFPGCSYTLVENYNASQTVGPPNPTGCGVAQPNWLDVWYEVEVPFDGNLTFQFQAGTLTDA
jgi:hypothetical protein